MRIWIILLTMTCAPAFAQRPASQPAPAQATPAQAAADASPPAPPEVDAALRARVEKFYQSFVSGKFSAAFEVVADDEKDSFIGSQKDTYKACDTARIAYSENFTKAAVTESCKSEWKWHGKAMPVTMPLVSFWKVIDGKWYWYPVKQLVYETPFGKMSSSDAANNGSSEGPRPMIPPDPSALAKTILKQITIDKTEIHIDSSKASLQEIQLSNGMLGVVRIAIDNVGQPGLGVKADRTVLRPKERARILVHYDPNDPALMCSDCLKRTEGTTVATIHVSPTNQVFNIKIIFERPSAKVQ